MHVCPRCQSDRLVKNGSAAGKPKKQCKQCGHQFTRATPRGKPLSTKINAVLWYLSDMSMNREPHRLSPPRLRLSRAHLNQGLGQRLLREARAHRTYPCPPTWWDVALCEEETPETLDLESLGSGYGAAARLGVWPGIVKL